MNALVKFAAVPDTGELIEHVKIIHSLSKRIIDDVIEIGRRLVECRDLLKGVKGKGKWRAWLKAEFSWSYRTADNYINVFRLTNDVKALSHKTVSLETLYLLAASETDKKVRDMILTRIDTGEKIEHKEVKELVRAAKAERESKLPNIPEDVCDRIEKLALRMHAADDQPHSTRSILNKIKADDPWFEFNNNWSGPLAKWLVNKHPKLSEFIKTRKPAAEAKSKPSKAPAETSVEATAKIRKLQCHIDELNDELTTVKAKLAVYENSSTVEQPRTKPALKWTANGKGYTRFYHAIGVGDTQYRISIGKSMDYVPDSNPKDKQFVEFFYVDFYHKGQQLDAGRRVGSTSLLENAKGLAQFDFNQGNV